MSNNKKNERKKRSNSEEEEEVEIPILPVSHENYRFDPLRSLTENQYKDVDQQTQRCWNDRAMTAWGTDEAMMGLITSLPTPVLHAINTIFLCIIYFSIF